MSYAPADVNVFVDAYLSAIAWTEKENLPKDSQFSQELIDKAWQDCHKFLILADGLIKLSDLANAGIDFWITRNHHGSGYWAYPKTYGEDEARRLTEIAQTFPTVDLYTDEPNNIYIYGG